MRRRGLFSCLHFIVIDDDDEVFQRLVRHTQTLTYVVIVYIIFVLLKLPICEPQEQVRQRERERENAFEMYNMHRIWMNVPTKVIYAFEYYKMARKRQCKRAIYFYWNERATEWTTGSYSMHCEYIHIKFVHFMARAHTHKWFFIFLFLGLSHILVNGHYAERIVGACVCICTQSLTIQILGSHCRPIRADVRAIQTRTHSFSSFVLLYLICL